MAPEHVRQWRSRARLRNTLVNERTGWVQRIRATLYHHGVNGAPGPLQVATTTCAAFRDICPTESGRRARSVRRSSSRACGRPHSCSDSYAPAVSKWCGHAIVLSVDNGRTRSVFVLASAPRTEARDERVGSRLSATRPSTPGSRLWLWRGEVRRRGSFQRPVAGPRGWPTASVRRGRAVADEPSTQSMNSVGRPTARSSGRSGEEALPLLAQLGHLATQSRPSVDTEREYGGGATRRKRAARRASERRCS